MGNSRPLDLWMLMSRTPAASAGPPGGGSLVLLQQPPQLRDEGEEAPVSIALKLLRVLAQGDEILPPGRTIIHGAEDPSTFSRL